MRVLVTLLALVTAPFLASVSQEPAGQSSVQLPEAANYGQCVASEHSNAPSHTWRGTGNGQHLANGWAKQAQRADACGAPPPPPSTTCTIGTGGMGEIAGMSWWDVNGNTWQDNPVSEPGQAGWTIELSCGGTVIATAVTGPGGTYAFGDLNAGLYDGTYLVCEVVQSGWRLTLPMTPRPCSGGFGYTVVIPLGLVDHQTWLANDFGNKTP